MSERSRSRRNGGRPGSPSGLSPPRRTGPTRIRTSSLTNGRWRLNQSGEIWLSSPSPASATRHVACPAIYVLPRDRDREPGATGSAPPPSRAAPRPSVPRFIESRYPPLASCRLFRFAGGCRIDLLTRTDFPRRAERDKANPGRSPRCLFHDVARRSFPFPRTVGHIVDDYSLESLERTDSCERRILPFAENRGFSFLRPRRRYNFPRARSTIIPNRHHDSLDRATIFSDAAETSSLTKGYECTQWR